MPQKKSQSKKELNIKNSSIENLMIENSPFLILRDKTDATITYINKSIEKFFDIKREDIIGKKWLSEISNSQKKEVLKNLSNAAKNGEPFKHTVSYKLKNGEAKIIDWFTTPLKDDDGNFIGEFEAFGIDTTDKYKIQNQLEKAEEQLELFFKQSLDGFFIMEADEPIEWSDTCNKEKSLRMFYHNFRVKKVNKAFLDQYSAKEEQMLGLSPADFFVHNYNYGIDVCKIILDKGYANIITDERRFTGEQMWIEAQYSLIKNDAGLITGIFGIQRDITEKVKLENELKENEFIFRNSFENNPLPIWIYDVDTAEFLAVNKAAIEHYGYTKKEFLQMKVQDLNCSDSLSRLEEIFIELRKNHEIKNASVWKHIKKDGSVIDVEINAQSIPYKNRRARINVINDITEKLQLQNSIKINEESYKGLFNTISDAIYIQDKNGVFLDVNNGAEKMYGYKRDEFIGRTPEFLSAPGRNDLHQVAAFIQDTFKNNNTHTFEFWGLKKDGTIFPKDVTINKAKYFGKDAIIAVARDISDRKNIEFTLKQSKENFQSIFNQIKDAIIIHDFEGNVLEVNHSACKLYNYSHEQIKQLTIDDLSAEINMQRFRLKKIWGKVKAGEKLDFDWIAKDSSGNIFDVNVTLKLNFWNGNEVIFAIIKDLREQKKIERAIKQTEKSYFGLFNTVTDLILIINFDGIIIDINNSTLNILGYSKEELLDKPLSLFSAPLKNEYNEILEKISHTFYTAQPSNFDFWFLTKDKTELPTNVRTAQSKYDDKTVIVLIARDITERMNYITQLKESEERFRNLYENAAIGIFRSTIDGRIIFANQSLLQILGYDNFEELKELKVQEKFYKNKEQRDNYIKELMNKGKVVGSEYELLKKDGTPFTVREYARVVKNLDGEIEYIEGTLEDVTEKTEKEKRLIESEAKLRELNATKDKFFSIIAHDLRSPFQGILGLSNILAEDEEMSIEEKNFYFKRLHDGLKNLFSLVDELLTWSRIQRGTMDYTPELNSIQACFNEVMAIVSGLADKKGININYDFEDNLICNCDKNMITTVMRNLITNAIKFTPSLGTILVKGYKTKDEIVVSIIDSGIGISKDDMKKLFRQDTPFTRRGTNDEAGTGLGLLLCKEFINKHNGKIWVESEEGKGSTFSFSIPIDSEG